MFCNCKYEKIRIQNLAFPREVYVSQFFFTNPNDNYSTYLSILLWKVNKYYKDLVYCLVLSQYAVVIFNIIIIIIHIIIILVYIIILLLIIILLFIINIIIIININIPVGPDVIFHLKFVPLFVTATLLLLCQSG